MAFYTCSFRFSTSISSGHWKQECVSLHLTPSLLSCVKWPQRPSHWSMEQLAGIERDCRIGSEDWGGKRRPSLQTLGRWFLLRDLRNFPITNQRMRTWFALQKWRLRTLRHLQTAAHTQPLDSDSDLSCTVPRLPLAMVNLEVCTKTMLSPYSSLPVCATSAETVRNTSITRIDTRKPCCSKGRCFLNVDKYGAK